MDYWFSCIAFTCWVRVEDEIITDGAPIIRKFIGQPFYNLIFWTRKQFKDSKWTII